jgi:hypothetical protein
MNFQFGLLVLTPMNGSLTGNVAAKAGEADSRVSPATIVTVRQIRCQHPRTAIICTPSHLVGRWASRPGSLVHCRRSEALRWDRTADVLGRESRGTARRAHDPPQQPTDEADADWAVRLDTPDRVTGSADNVGVG